MFLLAVNAPENVTASSGRLIKLETEMEYKAYDKNFSLAGKIAVITGAVKGIGNAIADLFAEKGAHVVLVDMLDEVQSAADAIRKKGVKALPVKADLTDKKDIERMFQKIIAEFGKIDIVVNNAGVVYLDDAETISEESWDRTMSVNLKAPFLVSQYACLEMKKTGGGKIINMASQAGIIALDRHVAYCASKAAIISMTKVTAFEWAEFGINVNSISPTVVLTELGKKAWAGEVGEAMKKLIPVGRFAHPEEIAAVALFLACDASAMITGENIVIDGGYTIK